MPMSSNSYSSLLSYVFPQELVNHFSITSIQEDADSTLHIHMDENIGGV